MSEKAPGFEEYTPSRLEWLSVMLNSNTPFLSFPNIEYIFIPGAEGKSLKLHVVYSKEIDIEKVNIRVEHIKKYALGVGKLHGWDSWLEIQEEIISKEEIISDDT